MLKSINLQRFSVLLFFTFITISCVSKKDVTYFQAASAAADTQPGNASLKYIATIQQGDILQIIVSSLSPEASAMFNPYLPAQATVIQNSQTNNLPPANGYLVDDEGDITLPLVGKIQVASLSTGKATTLITQKLE
ncbi:MAG: polysaccharide biosynthesis/export family protein, partial [Flavobacterium sp.]|nr:polysaccharide biosynthesis/export family protein [Pedobacter sp.]